MNIIIDNNVVISAFLIQSSIPAQAYRKIIQNHSLLMSVEIEAELVTTLRHKKFIRYFKEESIREELILSFLETCTTVSVHHKVTICRDVKDNMFLELALSGKADLILSGDNDLLVLILLKVFL